MEINNCQAEIYDILHPGSLGGDVEWYARLGCRTGGPVLELGAGTGRTVLPIARAGIEIHALEKDPEMLEKLRARLQHESPETRKLVRCIEGDMRQFQLPERFQLVQVPFRGFLCNRTRDEQISCLRSAREHLLPGGIFAMNVFHPSLAYMSRNHGPLEGVWRYLGECSHPEGGAIVTSEANRYDTVSQTVSSRIRCEHFDAGGKLITTRMVRLELAYLYPGDIRDLLRESGFSEVQIDGGYAGEPIDREGAELVVRAIR